MIPIVVVGMTRFLERLERTCLTNSISSKMRRAEPYKSEVVLTLCSFWAAFVLYNPPSNFASFPAAFAIAERMQGAEWLWATAALSGALIKTLGLMLTAASEAQTFAFWCRCMGLVISGIFWGAMGTSTTLGNPDTLFGVPGILMGLTAVWVLLRFPRMPSDVD